VPFKAQNEVKAIEQNENQKILLENSLQHQFSNPQELDLFKIQIVGKSIMEGIVVFTITNYDDNVIYSVKYPAIQLLGYAFDYEDGTVAEKDEYIRKKVDEYLGSDNFYSPAIKLTDRFDRDYSKEEIWEDIKSDQSAIGFNYCRSAGWSQRIAYSKSQKKVVMYFECC